jgi:hypothetical protein
MASDYRANADIRLGGGKSSILAKKIEGEKGRK